MSQFRSRGEIKIEDILKMNNMNYKTEYSFPDLVGVSGRPLRFDFAVFNDDDEIEFLIEFQGKQHYTDYKLFGGKRALAYQKYNDMQKKKYCQEHGYKLVEIPYWDYDIINYDYIIKSAYDL